MVIFYIIYLTAFDVMERGLIYVALDVLTLLASCWIHIQAIQIFRCWVKTRNTDRIEVPGSLRLERNIVVVVLFASISPNILPVFSATRVPDWMVIYLPYAWVWLSTIWLYFRLLSLHRRENECS